MKNSMLLLLIYFVLFYSNLFGQIDSLNLLIETATQKSPRLKMLELKKEAVRLRVVQNSNLADPMLSLGVSNLPVPTFAFNREPMTEKMIGLSQQIPFPGKLKRMAEAESKEVEMIELELIDAKNQIRKELTRSYNELRFTRKSIEILENTRSLLQKMSEIVSTQFIVSKASQQNLLKIELELTNLQRMTEELRATEKTHLAMINTVLFRSTDSPIQTKNFLEMEIKTLDLKDLLDIALMSNPILNSANVEKEKSQIEEKLAKYERLPMFNLSAKYAFRDRINGMPMDDLFSLMVDISLPLNYGGKVSAKIEETQLTQKYFQQKYDLSLQVITASLASSISKINSLSHRIKLIEEGSFIQAKENLKTALTEYQVGKIDFLNVIDAQMELLKIENELYRLKTDYLNEIAELEYLVGTKI